MKSPYSVEHYLKALAVGAHGTIVDLQSLRTQPMKPKLDFLPDFVGHLETYVAAADNNWIDPYSQDVFAQTLIKRPVLDEENHRLAYEIDSLVKRFRAFYIKDIPGLIDTCISLQMYANEKLRTLTGRVSKAPVLTKQARRPNFVSFDEMRKLGPFTEQRLCAYPYLLAETAKYAEFELTGKLSSLLNRKQGTVYLDLLKEELSKPDVHLNPVVEGALGRALFGEKWDPKTDDLQEALMLAVESMNASKHRKKVRSFINKIWNNLESKISQN